MGNADSQTPSNNQYSRSAPQRRDSNSGQRRRNGGSNQQSMLRLTPEMAAALRREMASRQGRRSGGPNGRRNGVRVPLSGQFGETLLSQIEEAQLRFAMERSRVETQMTPQGAPPVENSILDQLGESCLELSDLAEGNEQCVVCFEKQQTGDLAVILPCGHAFHKKCIFEWLKRHNTCPVCRLELNDHFKNPSNVQTFRKKMEDRRLKHKEEMDVIRKKLEGFTEPKSNSSSKEIVKDAAVIETEPKPFIEVVRGIEISSWRVKHLKSFLNTLEQDISKLNEKSALVQVATESIKKENLVMRSRGKLEAIASFLSIPFDDRCTDDILAEAIAVAGEKLCKGR